MLDREIQSESSPSESCHLPRICNILQRNRCPVRASRFCLGKDSHGGTCERDEICIIDYFSGQLDIYQGYLYGGSLPSSTRAPPPGAPMISLVGSFDTEYYFVDEVSIGDVWGDDKDEIVLADESANEILIYNHLGTVVNSFNCPFYFWDGLAVGDAHSSTKEEIVIAGSVSQKVTIKSNTGTTLTSFDFIYGYGDSIVVGDFYNNPNEEIIIGKSGDLYVYFCYFKNNEWKKGKTPIEIPFRTYDGLAIGNIVEYGLLEIVVGNNVENKVQYFDVNWGPRMNDAFKSNCKYKDIIYYRGHGNINNFGSFIHRNHFPLDFGGTNPVVIAPTCLCGDYVNGGIAEAFLDSGAGAFIGSTEISRSPENSNAGKLLYSTYWNQNDIDIGTAFTNLCRDQYTLSFHWSFWVTEYNLYGDPKYGTTEAILPIYDVIPIPHELVFIELSDFEVDTIENTDFVEIPGGRTLLETNQYQVPIYTETILIPDGYSVQGVQLINRSELVMSRGLQLPVTRNEIDIAQDNSSKLAMPVISGNGWYPQKVYEWEVFNNANGSSTLIITVYPFLYNTKTSEVRYYKNFQFGIDFILSSVSITEVHLPGEFDFGEVAEAEVELENSGNINTNVILSAVIESYQDSRIIDGLQLQTLTLRPGNATTTFSFDTSGLPAGYHKLTINIEDASGQLLDTANVRFKVGVSDVQISEFSVIPQIYKIGHNVKIEMSYRNTGSVNIDGTVNIVIKNEAGGIIMEYYENISGLTPAAESIFEAVWSTVGIDQGRYYITGYVVYDSKYAVSPTIKVMDFATALRDIIEYIKSLELPRGIENSLASKLENAASAIERGQYMPTLKKLKAFLNELAAINGKKITSAHAEILALKVETVIDNMGG